MKGFESQYLERLKKRINVEAQVAEMEQEVATQLLPYSKLNIVRTHDHLIAFVRCVTHSSLEGAPRDCRESGPSRAKGRFCIPKAGSGGQ